MKVFDFSAELSKKTRYQLLAIEHLLNVRVASLDQLLALTHGPPKSSKQRQARRRDALKWLSPLIQDGVLESHRVTAPCDIGTAAGPIARCGCTGCVVDWRIALSSGPRFGEPNGWNSLGDADSAFRATQVYSLTTEYYRKKMSLPEDLVLSELIVGSHSHPNGHVEYFERQIPWEQAHIVSFEHYLHVSQLFLSLRQRYPQILDCWFPGPAAFNAELPGTFPDAYIFPPGNWKQPTIAIAYGSRLLSPVALHHFLYECEHVVREKGLRAAGGLGGRWRHLRELDSVASQFTRKATGFGNQRGIPRS